MAVRLAVPPVPIKILSVSRLFLALTLLTHIAACTTSQRLSGASPAPTQPSPEALYQQRLTVVTAITHWSFNGRAAVQRAGEGWSATLHWIQNEADYRLRIIAPLGRGTYELFSSTDGVSLVDASNRIYHAQSPDALLFDNTGWQLPVSDIQYWVRGIIPAGSSPSQVSLDPDGLVKDFAVDGWRVSILEYDKVDGVAMPRKLFLSYRESKMRLVVNKWDLKNGEN